MILIQNKVSSYKVITHAYRLSCLEWEVSIMYLIIFIQKTDDLNY